MSRGTQPFFDKSDLGSIERKSRRRGDHAIRRGDVVRPDRRGRHAVIDPTYGCPITHTSVDGERFTSVGGDGPGCQREAGGRIAGDGENRVIRRYTCTGNRQSYIRRSDGPRRDRDVRTAVGNASRGTN